MVDNVDKCMLFSVAAASVPKQSSTNLVAFDKACTSVPAVVPTSSNVCSLPNRRISTDNISAPVQTQGLDLTQALGRPAPTPAQTQEHLLETVAKSSTNERLVELSQLALRVLPCPCLCLPVSAMLPLVWPHARPMLLANRRCSYYLIFIFSDVDSFEFGKETSQGANICKLFSVAAASVPAPQSGQTFAVYDVECSI